MVAPKIILSITTTHLKSASYYFTIPEGFPELLQDFTVSVLRERPSDVVEYAVSYFTDLAIRRNPDRIQVAPSNGVAEHIPTQASSTTVIENDEEKPVEKKVSAVKFQDEAENIDSEEDEGPPEDAPAPLIDMSALQRDDDVYSDDGELLSKSHSNNDKNISYIYIHFIF